MLMFIKQKIAEHRGRKAAAIGARRKAVPLVYREPGREPEAFAWQRGWDEKTCADHGLDADDIPF
jgi:hypothetical protein